MFGPKSFDKIIGSLKRITDELSAHAEHHEWQHESKVIESYRLQDEAASHAENAKRARETAARISALFNGA